MWEAHSQVITAVNWDVSLEGLRAGKVEGSKKTRCCYAHMHHCWHRLCRKKSATQNPHESQSLDKEWPIDKTAGIAHSKEHDTLPLALELRNMHGHPFTNQIVVRCNSRNLHHGNAGLNVTHTTSDLETTDTCRRAYGKNGITEHTHYAISRYLSENGVKAPRNNLGTRWMRVCLAVSATVCIKQRASSYCNEEEIPCRCRKSRSPVYQLAASHFNDWAINKAHI
jgi:hypothetical protein